MGEKLDKEGDRVKESDEQMRIYRNGMFMRSKEWRGSSVLTREPVPPGWTLKAYLCVLRGDSSCATKPHPLRVTCVGIDASQ